MADVFISYSMKTASELVRDVADALQARGISCWYAGEHQKNGIYAEQIVTAIEDCRVFLLVMNRAALHSLNVISETAIAYNRLNDEEEIDLIPFRVEDCSPKKENKAMYYYLAPLNIVDGCPPSPEHIRSLVDGISRIVNA